MTTCNLILEDARKHGDVISYDMSTDKHRISYPVGLIEGNLGLTVRRGGGAADTRALFDGKTFQFKSYVSEVDLGFFERASAEQVSLDLENIPKILALLDDPGSRSKEKDILPDQGVPDEYLTKLEATIYRNYLLRRLS